MTSFWFELLILLMIVASAVFLAMNGPTVKDGSVLDRASNYADIVFAAVFTFEMVIKVSSFTPGASSLIQNMA